MQPVAGTLSDRVSLRVLLVTACATAASGSLLFCYANVFGIIILGRVLVAIGASLVTLSNLKLSSNWFSLKSYPYCLGIVMVFGGLGSFIASSPLQYLAARFGWRPVFLSNSLILLVMGVVIQMSC
ncbi:major facilitator superfamily protein, partial [Kipferlia bialata]|eukprot:g6880.t1